jgi:sterol 3beta-glucosyltransferase
VRHPYLGAKQEGSLGFGKGIGRGLGGLFFHSMAGKSTRKRSKHASLTILAIFGLPGYFLKGVERGLLARHLTPLQAEIFLIQLRRSALEYRDAVDADKVELVAKWKDVRASMSKY